MTGVRSMANIYPCGGFSGYIVGVLSPFTTIDGGQRRSFPSPHGGHQMFLSGLAESSHGGDPP